MKTLVITQYENDIDNDGNPIKQTTSIFSIKVNDYQLQTMKNEDKMNWFGTVDVETLKLFIKNDSVLINLNDIITIEGKEYEVVAKNDMSGLYDVYILKAK